MEVFRTAGAHAGGGQAAGADRYMVHVVVDAGTVAGGAGRCELVDGTPLAPGAVDRVACDASLVGHLVAGDEPLRLGRRQRAWSAAQRRAILVRDAGRCRYPGCLNTIVDIHHLRAWSQGGPTDTDNGLLVCGFHHGLLHDGFTAHGDANGPLYFCRPDGTHLATTTPPGRTPATAATTGGRP
jgi:hypothetical protein